MQQNGTLEVTKTVHWRLQRWDMIGYNLVLQRRYDCGTTTLQRVQRRLQPRGTTVVHGAEEVTIGCK
jgi:hypothetical protein